MSAIFYHQLISKDETKFLLKTTIIHQDECYIPEKLNFVLQALWTKTRNSEEPTAISELISIDEILDSDWVNANCSRFVKSVKVVEEKNYPPADDWDYNETKKNNLLPVVIHEIELNDLGLISDLNEGDTWGSAAYDMGGI
jgi:hypothetical protein